MVVLSVFVFKPTLKILDGRKNKTAELEKETEMLLAEAEVMDCKYNDKITEARIEGSKLEQELLGAGENEARSIINEARQDSRDAISKTRGEILADSAKTKQELSEKIGDYAKMIVAKILGKNG